MSKSSQGSLIFILMLIGLPIFIASIIISAIFTIIGDNIIVIILMTSQLREKIKYRDNYKCCSCSLGIVDEPNLLLEIDHKIPLSKGGITTYDNLQTLCWKCNRTKGAKF